MSQLNYIRNPSLFNTGLLPPQAQIRIKQGLDPQEISNVCQIQKENGVCNNELLYPFYVDNRPEPDSIPNDKACARYVQAP